jgi:two-component system, cell cycle sensor histidine kinase and response regulator CckA
MRYGQRSVDDCPAPMNARNNPAEGPSPSELSPLWATLATHTSDFIGVMDEHGVALFMNRSVRGADAGEVEGKSLEEFLSPERARQIRSMLEEARASGQPVVNDALRIDALDGTERWFIEKCIPVPEPHGAPRFMLFRTETTHLRRAEQELRASEVRYRTLFDSNPDPVVVIEASTLVILEANPAAVRLYGLAEEDRGARSWIDLFHADDREGLRERFRSNPRDEQRTVVRQIRRDGAWVTAEIVDNPIVYSGVAARMAVVRDVTERELLEEQLRHAQKMEAMGVFAGGVAHDFNNLLTVITGCAGSLRETTAVGSEASEDLDHVLDAAERGSHLTKKLVLFSRRLVLKTAPLDVVHVVDELVGMLRKLLGEGIDLDVRHLASSTSILGDRTEIEQLVSNLVLNAAQSILGRGRVLVQTSQVDLEPCLAALPRARPGRYVELCVSDDGHGMDDATLARVFEPFFTTKPDGTGLGLAIVHGVVERHHGFVRAESKTGVGTSIRVYLPISADSAPAAASGKVEPRGTERVLVVDDEPMVRKLTERMLRRLGYHVVGASDGEEALRTFERDLDAFDLVVMDVVMPKLGGPEAFARMRLLRPRLKALFVSGYAGEAPGLSAMLQEPGLLLLQKPFTAQKLAEEVRRILETAVVDKDVT